MRFVVFSRQMTENKDWIDANCDVPYIWVSITDPDSKPVEMVEHPNFRAVLHLQFHDVEKEGIWFGTKKNGRELLAMQDEHAKQILDFVDEWKDKVKLIGVNCEAGICRSSGTAAALSLILLGHDSGIGDDKRYLPNGWVKSKILREARRRLGQEIE
jgi:predicted protein tyrosine phosphatase